MATDFKIPPINEIKKNVRRYFRGKFRSDLTAGSTVAMVVIPQSMAYAAIAGINPIYGLFTAIIPTIIAALFSSFPLLITGPTNPTALVTASVLIGYANRENYFEFVVALAIIAGLFNIIFGLLKLGTITRYISNSVLVGFLTAAGVLVITYQLGNLFGVDLSREGGVWGIFSHLLSRVSEINIFTFIVSAISVSSMILIRKLKRKLPAALMTIIIAGLFVYLTGWSGDQNVALVMDIGLPEQIRLGFHVPQISIMEFINLGITGAAVALFGFMETISIAKSMSQMSGETLDASREMVSQGLASFIGGFFQCMPSAGSPSRTVVNVVNGARTRFSAIFSGLSVLVFILLFSKLIGFIPLAALAAVVIVSATGLININLIKFTWQSALKSKIVLVITFVSTLILPLEYAIYLGILTTILIYLGESSHVNLSYIVEDDAGHYVELPMERIEKHDTEIAIVNIEGDLYFAAVEDLQERIKKILETNLKVLILRFRRTHLLASTGVMALERLVKTARDKGVVVLFCGLHEEILKPLEDAGIMDVVGESHTFHANRHLFESTQRALEEAKLILENRKQAKKSAEESAENTKGEENNENVRDNA